jgi:hypothetical protein
MADINGDGWLDVMFAMRVLINGRTRMAINLLIIMTGILEKQKNTD